MDGDFIGAILAVTRFTVVPVHKKSGPFFQGNFTLSKVCCFATEIVKLNLAISPQAGFCASGFGFFRKVKQDFQPSDLEGKNPSGFLVGFADCVIQINYLNLHTGLEVRSL